MLISLKTLGEVENLEILDHTTGCLTAHIKITSLGASTGGNGAPPRLTDLPDTTGIATHRRVIGAGHPTDDQSMGTESANINHAVVLERNTRNRAENSTLISHLTIFINYIRAVSAEI